MRLFLAFFAAFFLAVPADAQSAEERRQLEWVLERGRLIFELDRAAWVTTDDMHERLPDFVERGVRGWIVEPEQGGYRVIYYAGEGAELTAVYSGRVKDRRVVSAQVFPEGDRPPLTASQVRLANALKAIPGREIRACAPSGLNHVTVPPAGDAEPIHVYFLTPQTEAGIYPFGGHSRFTVSPAGEVVAQRTFTNTCIELSRTAPDGSEPVALTITHLLDPNPTEIHVFLSIWIGLPIYVVTGEQVWEVTDRRIRLVDGPGSRR